MPVNWLRLKKGNNTCSKTFDKKITDYMLGYYATDHTTYCKDLSIKIRLSKCQIHVVQFYN